MGAFAAEGGCRSQDFGGHSYSILSIFELNEPSGCVNDDSDYDSDGPDYTCTLYYDNNPGSCGRYDTSTFFSNTFCCVCGGGNS